MRALFISLILLTLSGPVAAQFVRELPDAGQTDRFSDPAYEGYSATRVLPARTHADGFDANLRYELEGTWGMFYREDDVTLPTDSLPVLEAEGWTYKQLQVPGTWDRQHAELFDKQMPVYLRYKFQYDPGEHPQHLPILQSEGIFREASVWLNGQLLGEFDLPYLPFAFPLWDALQSGSNTLVIRIDNRLTYEDLPVATKFHDGKHGWFPYGGLYRPIFIEHLPPIYPQKVLFETSDNAQLDLWVQLQNLTDRKQMLQLQLGEVVDDEERLLDQVVISTPATPAQSDGQHDWASGQQWVKYSKRFRQAQPWDVDNPGNVQTYYLKISRPTASGGFKTLATYTYNWAFKQFELQEGGRYRLNDNPIVLKGMNRHEDHYLLGPRYTDNLIDGDVGFLKSMEVNFCRPGHYPNDVRVLQKMEQAGILLVEEIPVYQLNKKQMADPHLVAQSKASLHRMIIRDFNRPGICMWSIGNEVHYWRKSARTYLQTLHDYAKQLDPQRETFQARLVLPPFVERIAFKDRVSDITDVTGLNTYHGWYYSKAKKAGKHVRRIHKKMPEQHFIISEFGAGAMQGRHTDEPDANEPRKKHSYSEEFQAQFLTTHLKQYIELPFINGIMPWVLADFRMQWTPATGKPHPRDKTNLKGLLDMNRNPKAGLDAVYQQYKDWRP